MSVVKKVVVPKEKARKPGRVLLTHTYMQKQNNSRLQFGKNQLSLFPG